MVTYKFISCCASATSCSLVDSASGILTSCRIRQFCPPFRRVSLDPRGLRSDICPPFRCVSQWPEPFYQKHSWSHVFIVLLQVRAAVPMYLLARRIKALGIKVVLSGEGADEVFGGYLYFHKAPSPEEFHKCVALQSCPLLFNNGQYCTVDYCSLVKIAMAFGIVDGCML